MKNIGFLLVFLSLLLTSSSLSGQDIQPPAQQTATLKQGKKKTIEEPPKILTVFEKAKKELEIAKATIKKYEALSSEVQQTEKIKKAILAQQKKITAVEKKHPSLKE